MKKKLGFAILPALFCIYTAPVVAQSGGDITKRLANIVFTELERQIMTEYFGRNRLEPEDERDFENSNRGDRKQGKKAKRHKKGKGNKRLFRSLSLWLDIFEPRTLPFHHPTKNTKLKNDDDLIRRTGNSSYRFQKLRCTLICTRVYFKFVNFSWGPFFYYVP